MAAAEFAAVRDGEPEKGFFYYVSKADTSKIDRSAMGTAWEEHSLQ
jgi:hypothetical protein